MKMISRGIKDYFELKNKETADRPWDGGHEHNGKKESDDPLSPLGHLLEKHGLAFWELLGIKTDQASKTRQAA